MNYYYTTLTRETLSIPEYGRWAMEGKKRTLSFDMFFILVISSRTSSNLSISLLSIYRRL